MADLLADRLPFSGGLLDLRFAVASDGRTRLSSRAHRFPLRMTAPLYLDPGDPGMAFVYVQNPTGGVFAGDRLALRVCAGAGARVHVTTTAAAKVHRMEEGAAVQSLDVRLGDAAYVEYAPEPLIPQAGSRLEQEIAVEVGEGAAFLAAETVAPGRFARGELFQYDRLLLRTTVRDAGGRELLADTLLLEPSRRSPHRRGLLGAHAFLGTVLAVAPRGDAGALAERLHGAVRNLPGSLAAAGTLPSEAGVLVRVLAGTSTAAGRAIEAAWRVARETLIGLPPPRRRK